MTCEKAQSLVALSASGDAGERGIELLARHIAVCDRCAAFRAAWHPLPLGDVRAGLPFDGEVLAGVRGRVMEKVTAERPARRGWGMLLVRSVAVAAVLALIVIGVRLRSGHDGPPTQVAAASHSQHIATMAPLPHPQITGPARPIAPEHSPNAVKRHHHRRQRPAQPERVEVASAARPDSPEVPIHMEIYTSDPNVRIIWISDREADPGPAPTPNRSK